MNGIRLPRLVLAGGTLTFIPPLRVANVNIEAGDVSFTARA